MQKMLCLLALLLYVMTCTLKAEDEMLPCRCQSTGSICPPPEFPNLMLAFQETLKRLPNLLQQLEMAPATISNSCVRKVNLTELNGRLCDDIPYDLENDCSTKSISNNTFDDSYSPATDIFPVKSSIHIVSEITQDAHQSDFTSHVLSEITQEAHQSDFTLAQQQMEETVYQNETEIHKYRIVTESSLNGSEENGDDRKSIIIGVVFGILALLIIIVFIVILFLQLRQNKNCSLRPCLFINYLSRQTSGEHARIAASPSPSQPASPTEDLSLDEVTLKKNQNDTKRTKNCRPGFVILREDSMMSAKNQPEVTLKNVPHVVLNMVGESSCNTSIRSANDSSELRNTNCTNQNLIGNLPNQGSDSKSDQTKIDICSSNPKNEMDELTSNGSSLLKNEKEDEISKYLETFTDAPINIAERQGLNTSGHDNAAFDQDMDKENTEGLNTKDHTTDDAEKWEEWVKREFDKVAENLNSDEIK